MALTQNKYLIVTEAPDGNTQLVTTAAYGDTEIDALDEWETVDGVLTPKNGTATNGVGLATSTTAYTYTGQTDFGSAGSNISYTSDNWTNSLVPSANSYNFGNYQTSNSSPYTVASDSAAVAIAWKAFQGTTNEDQFSMDKLGANYIDIDFGTAFIPTQWSFYGNNSSVNFSPVSGTIQGWNGASWDTLDAQTSLSPLANSVYGPFAISTATSYQKYRCTNFANNGVGGVTSIAEIFIYDGATATTLNTVEVITGLSTPTLATSTIVGKTNAGVTILDTALNIQYDLDGAGYTSLETLAAFKTRGDLVITTSFDFKIQPIGSQIFDSVTIYTPFTESLMLANGTMRVLQDEVILGEMSASGYTFPDLTVQATAVNKVDAPASASATGTTGQIAWDADYIYICTATDTWKRVAIATW